jgi:hypothetical protein
MWLAAAAPGLFAAVRRLEASDPNYHRAAAVLAERIGAELVPSEELPATGRRQLLAIRRRLHHGVPLGHDDCRQLEKLGARLGAAGLAAELAHAERLAADARARRLAPGAPGRLGVRPAARDDRRPGRCDPGQAGRCGGHHAGHA